jgi:uncharacterized alkaline shock family protein YloU
MAEPQDERLSGDLPVAPIQLADEEAPSVSHEVIASYVADAARSVHGIADLHLSPWKGFSSRVREIHSGGVAVRESQPGIVDVGIHVRVAWGSVIPELASKVEEAVRERVAALLSIDLGTVTLFVDEIAGPPEVGSPKEG